MNDDFHGPHIGHPVLRRRSQRPLKPWWVLIGRSAMNSDDEVWTNSRKLLRCIHAALFKNWYDRYATKSGAGFEKPFVTRSVAERELANALIVAEEIGITNSLLNWTIVDNKSWYPGQLTERLFDLLTNEKVLRNPTVREFRPIVSVDIRHLDAREHRYEKAVDRAKVWVVHEATADLWLATRLLLLEDNRR